MPWASVAELRSSELFKKMASLQKMGTQKLQRFLEVFGRVYERAIRGGASQQDAETRATPIALVAARSATIMPAGRKLETKVATFALFAQDMVYSGGAIDTDMKYADIADINDVMVGQTFFGHSHDRNIAEPLGVIRQAFKREDLPDDVRDKVDEGILIAVQASFFEDVPTEDRITTVSPEWMTLKTASGEEIQIPTNFITTMDPANDQVLGVGRVAEAGKASDGKSFEGEDAVEGSRITMPPTPEELQAKVATLQKEVDASKEKATTLDTLQKKHASLEKEHTDLVAKVAALGGTKPEEGKQPSQDKALEGLTSKMSSLEKSVKDMESTLQKKEAEAWADGVIKAKEIATDAKPKLANLFITAKQAALDLEASLPERVNKPGESDANVGVEKLDAKQAEARLTFIKGAFGPLEAKA